MTTPRVTVPVEPIQRLILAADSYGVRYLDSDDMSAEAEELQAATEAMKDLIAAPAPQGGAVKLHLKLLDTLKPFAEVAEKLKHCHVVEICEPTPDNPSRNIIPIPREWFERAADDLETIAIQLHGAGALSEGQASKLTGLDRVEVRKLADALATREEAPAEAETGEREAIARIIYPQTFYLIEHYTGIDRGDGLTPIEREPAVFKAYPKLQEERDAALRKADAILALRAQPQARSGEGR